MARDKDQEREQRRDKTVEDSFPASDPPANSGIVGPTGEHQHASSRPEPSERSDDARPKGRPTSDRHATETAHVWEDDSAQHQR